MQIEPQILDLFPTPLYVTELPLKYSSILPWFFKQEMLSDPEHVDQSNYGQRSKNSYILNEPEASGLAEYILGEVENFAQNTLHFDYPKFKFGQSWLSFKLPGQLHTIHSHPNSLISGVFYFGDEDESIPAIKFHKITTTQNVSYISPKYKPNKGKSKYASEFFSINYKPGLLLLFPSYLYHSVPINKTDKVRCSLAFNSIPVDGFGQEQTLTELKF